MWILHVVLRGVLSLIWPWPGVRPEVTPRGMFGSFNGRILAAELPALFEHSSACEPGEMQSCTGSSRGRSRKNARSATRV